MYKQYVDQELVSMPCRNAFEGVIVPDFSARELDKLIRLISDEFMTISDEGKFYKQTVLPLLSATQLFLNQTTTEPNFRVFQRYRTDDEKTEIMQAITTAITNATQTLATFDKSDDKAIILARAITHCSQCVKNRLRETQSMPNEQHTKNI